MVSIKNIKKVLDDMILSASGWRGIFACNEESKNEQISETHGVICAAAAYIFVEYIGSLNMSGKTRILLGTDTRPTGKAIIEAMLPVLIASGCDVSYAGVTAAPEIMAWARSNNNSSNYCSGFIYISASHNPIGHNGIKFGLTDGGVLAADEAVKLIDRFRLFLDRDDCAAKIETLNSSANLRQVKEVYDNITAAKSEAQKAYYDFCGEVVWGSNNHRISGASRETSLVVPAAACALKEGLTKRPFGIVCDFNGSARTTSIDRDFFSALGFKFISINDEPGQIAHRIVPEGESLEPCRRLLEEEHSRDPSFVMGYVPDCDGDRGNLVIWDDAAGIAHALEAQEVFALACAAEFSYLVWTGELQITDSNKACKAAIAVNDPTSMRIDRIAETFGVSVFRAEVGEANVVSLARKLREEGYLVRILGEGSAGGNITHPSAVRDPIHTVLAIAKMLCIRSGNGNLGLFEIWRDVSGQIDKYREDFTLADIIAGLPKFVTTPAYSKDAVMRIKTNDHTLLKNRYQQIFLREWERRKDELKSNFAIYEWEAIAYNGIAEKHSLKNFGEAGRGGLKILFLNSEGRGTAYIWMRGSATEPVFRIMADVDFATKFPIQSADNHPERYLLDWQRKMIMEADNS